MYIAIHRACRQYIFDLAVKFKIGVNIYLSLVQNWENFAYNPEITSLFALVVLLLLITFSMVFMKLWMLLFVCLYVEFIVLNYKVLLINITSYCKTTSIYQNS